MSYGNFVRVKVVTPLAIDTTSFAIEAAVAPNTLPPLDGGLLVLVDSPNNPAFIEVIRYGYRTNLALYDVQRGQEGTAARAWTGNTYAFQSLMAGEFNTMVATLAGKEPAIAAGTAVQYWKGTKAWADLATDVLAIVLTGLSLTTGTAITAADTVLSSLGKLQKQISDATTNLAANVRATVLTGYALGSNTALAATDSVLTAFGKTQGQMNAKAPLASPALTGVPTAPTAALGTNTTQIATMAAIKAAIDALIGGAPGALDALNELSAALGNDPNFATTMTNNLALKAPLASPALTGTPTVPTAADGTNTTQVASTAFVQAAIGGYLSKAVTGGTVVLTASEASNPVIGLSGALTSNLILEIPVAALRIYSINNGTTGAFTVSIKVVGLAPTVLVAQGKRNLVYTNGVGAYDAINDFDAIALTGVSTCITAAVGTNTTQVASTAYTVAEIGSRAPTKTGVGASGSWAIAITGNAASATTLGGLTATIAELNYCDGVTSNIQTQLNGKVPLTGSGASGSWSISVTGNAATASTFAGTESDWQSYRSRAVANMLGWKNYGNGHVIFDASAGTAPNGAAVNNTNPTVDWSATYPTLMGWNGSSTYGVRVARAYQAEKCVDTGWVSLSLINSFTQDASEPLQIRRVGNIVYLQGLFKRTTPPAALLQTTTIPSGYRPTKQVTGVGRMTADNTNWALADVVVNPTGVTSMGLLGLPSQNNATWVINTSWVTDYA